jgi:hypothetical protein
MGRLTMGRSCDGVWWQVEHGPLQSIQWDQWKGKIIGAKVW